ncbi:class I SAM-dependent methyltransferase [Thermoleophilia bacterium SCSIO 60948]|nr:class I SAM-dependent methyltransferase [Thermoleophilia bacterium SCSIO 60948]
MTDEAQRLWDRIHSRRNSSRHPQPHPYVIGELAAIAPGSALELGCGEGANAIWLATQGWTVTGVDVSEVALDRAAALARRVGVASRVRWEHADLQDWAATETVDLAAAFYLHTPLYLDYPATLRRAAEQVRAGGTLLVIGHYTLPPWAWDPEATGGLPSGSELASALALDDREWRIGVADELARAVTYDGRQQVILDAVVHAVRTASSGEATTAVVGLAGQAGGPPLTDRCLAGPRRTSPRSPIAAPTT